MKSLRIISLLSFLLTLSGLQELNAQQWANNGTHIYNTNTGYVGIGTGTSFTPTSKLHINNGSTVADIMCESAYSGTGNHSVGNLRLKNSTTGDMFNITLRKNGTVDEMLQSCYIATDTPPWREFIYFNFGNRKYEMRNGIMDAEYQNSGNLLFNMLGNVGIKTSSPLANLHVAETASSYTAAFGTPVSIYTSGTNVSIGDDNAAALLYIGQNTNDKGFLRWNYNETPALAYFSVGAYMGGHPLILQEVGGKVGIHTITPAALLDVYVDANNFSRMGFNNTWLNYFYHNEDPADGIGQATAYFYRTRSTQNFGSSYSLNEVNTAIKGYNFWGDEYTFGTCGFTDFDNTRCGGVLGASSSGLNWGSLGYKSSGHSFYGGYFTSYVSGSGKSSQPAHTGIGIGAWGDLFGADIHGKIYGTYTEGENYALFSNGVVYKNNLDVNLQHNQNGTNTPLYTNVSSDVTIMTSGIATLSGGKASIVFEKAFTDCVSASQPVVVTVTPIGGVNAVSLSEVTSTGFKVVELNNGKSSVTVNYIAIGKRAGYEKPQLAKEVIDGQYVNKLSQGLHNDNDLQTNGEGLYYENGQLVVGQEPSTQPGLNK
jgi:hypothetical protein